jgi:hypothetical protein
VQPASIPDATIGDGEEVDALPVLSAPAPVDARPSTALPEAHRTALPAVQAAAAAAGGFVAGAAVVGLVHRRHKRTAALRSARRGRGRRGSGMASEIVQVVGSRSLLVDVHLLGRPGDS